MSKRVMSLVMVFAVLSVLCFGTASVGAAGRAGVTFYSDANFTRNDVTLEVGRYTLTQLQAAGIKNDDVSSIKIPGGYVVRVYQHDNFGGDYWTFTSNVSNLTDYGCNDIMSSVVISKATQVTGVTFYSDANFTRNDVTLGVGRYTLTQLQAAGIRNDDVSSIKIPGGYAVRVYQHDNFGGDYWTFTSNVSNLTDYGCNDTISSVEITLLSKK